MNANPFQPRDGLQYSEVLVALYLHKEEVVPESLFEKVRNLVFLIKRRLGWHEASVR